MQLSVTFRHMDASDALKDYAREKVERIRKYFPDPMKAHVVLICDRGYNHIADVMITLHNGIIIKGEETTEDMYSSIDLVMAKIERQVRRYKEKIRDHKGRESIHGQREIVHSVMQVHVEEGANGTAPASKHDHDDDVMAAAPEQQFKIIKKSKFQAKPMTSQEAVMQMNLLAANFLVFTNATTHEVNVIYRRDDGTFGLIETGNGSHPAASDGARAPHPSA